MSFYYKSNNILRGFSMVQECKQKLHFRYRNCLCLRITDLAASFRFTKYSNYNPVIYFSGFHDANSFFPIRNKFQLGSIISKRQKAGNYNKYFSSNKYSVQDHLQSTILQDRTFKKNIVSLINDGALFDTFFSMPRDKRGKAFEAILLASCRRIETLKAKDFYRLPELLKLCHVHDTKLIHSILTLAAKNPTHRFAGNLKYLKLFIKNLSNLGDVCPAQSSSILIYIEAIEAYMVDYTLSDLLLIGNSFASIKDFSSYFHPNFSRFISSFRQLVLSRSSELSMSDGMKLNIYRMMTNLAHYHDNELILDKFAEEIFPKIKDINGIPLLAEYSKVCNKASFSSEKSTLILREMKSILFRDSVLQTCGINEVYHLLSSLNYATPEYVAEIMKEMFSSIPVLQKLKNSQVNEKMGRNSSVKFGIIINETNKNQPHDDIFSLPKSLAFNLLYFLNVSASSCAFSSELSGEVLFFIECMIPLFRSIMCYNKLSNSRLSLVEAINIYNFASSSQKLLNHCAYTIPKKYLLFFSLRNTETAIFIFIKKLIKSEAITISYLKVIFRSPMFVKVEPLLSAKIIKYSIPLISMYLDYYCAVSPTFDSRKKYFQDCCSVLGDSLNKISVEMILQCKPKSDEVFKDLNTYSIRDNRPFLNDSHLNFTRFNDILQLNPNESVASSKQLRSIISQVTRRINNALRSVEQNAKNMGIETNESFLKMQILLQKLAEISLKCYHTTVVQSPIDEAKCISQGKIRFLLRKIQIPGHRSKHRQSTFICGPSLESRNNQDQLLDTIHAEKDINQEDIQGVYRLAKILKSNEARSIA